MKDREIFLKKAKGYIGQSGYGVCIQKLSLGFVCDWCAFSVSCIMWDCGFIGKYIKEIEGGAGAIPRYSDGKYGTWFRKGKKAPQAGDLFFLRYADYPYQDKYFCDHVGIVESVKGNTLTTLEGNVDGRSGNWAETSSFKRKTRYLNDGTVYAFYRPHWQDEEEPEKPETGVPDITYQVHTLGGAWLPDVRNDNDYAGIENRKIDGIRMSVSSGHICYRAHLKGGRWLPWVTDRQDYAGIFGKSIDAVQAAYYGNGRTPEYTVEYRVSYVGSSAYLSYVKGYNNINDDGYAGSMGKDIDKIQARVVKK